MSNMTRTPQPDPRPESKEPRDDRPSGLGVSAASFYAENLSSATREELQDAVQVQSLDGEIAILRHRLKKFLEEARKHPKRNYDHRILKAAELVIRAYAAKNRVSGNSPEDAAENVAAVIKDISLGLGVDLIPGKTNA